MSNQHTDSSTRGFAAMDEDRQREIASKGGHSQGREEQDKEKR